MLNVAKRLVDNEKGYVDRRIYTDLDIYQQELEQVWGRCWIGIGHTSQVPHPNDFFAAYIAEDPILVTRDSRGNLHAFLNMCRHRGNRICRADLGNTQSFMCTYHGWTFSPDGKLVGVPGYKEAYFEELDRSQWGLVEARCDSYKGLIFANWDQSAPSLVDYLGDMAWYLDVQLDRRAGGTELLAGVQKHMMGTNWKIAADNTSGDSYHFPITHGSALSLRRSTSKPGLNTDPNTVHVYAGNGHCVMNRYIGPSREVSEGLTPVVMEYFKQHAEEMRQRVGEIRARQNIGLGNIFPATAYHSSPALRLRIPRGPLKTEEWTYCLVDKDAPEEVKTALRRSHTSSFGPAGLVEMDDANNWSQVTNSGLIREARKQPMNFQLGLGRQVTSEALPGALTATVTETNQRAFYGFWAEMMDAASWGQVRLSPTTRS